jgi:nicotinate-nucleotide adenylyltransferase
MKSKIGILGGSFDPIHNGHIAAAQTALEAFALDEILVCPCNMPSHKPELQASPLDRAAMVEAAIESLTSFSMSDADIRRGGRTYSIDTVRDIMRERPGSELHFIIGSDTLADLHRWRDIMRLLGLCSFDIIARPGFDPGTITETSLRLPDPWPSLLLANTATGRLVDVSSSKIRKRVKNGESIKSMVPEPVESYIALHGLYCL